MCFSLIAGGAVLLWVDRLDLKPRYHDAMRFTLPMYLIIGLAQCVSMIPGVSRSGSTIVAAMLLGADRRAAAEFSFWLAMRARPYAVAAAAARSETTGKVVDAVTNLTSTRLFARLGFERAVRGFEAVVTGRADDPRVVVEMATAAGADAGTR